MDKMTLYYGTGSCSLAPHIVLREGGFDFDLQQVNLQTKQMAHGGDWASLNPKGYVPALNVPAHGMLTEGVAMMQYLADHAPNRDAKPAPANGTIDRYRLQEWMNFISTELHKGIGAFFSPLMGGDYATSMRERVAKRLAYVNDHLNASGKPWLMGDTFSVADAYLFTVLRWTVPTQMDLSPYPALQALMARVAARPAVQAAMAAEGIA